MKLASRGRAVESSGARDSGGAVALLGMNHSQGVALMGDADIRPALRMRLQSDHGTDADTVIIEELGICRGQVRVDLAVVNGSIHGYEIKSERDSLRRLASQASVYSRVLDHVTLVVATRHIADAMEIVPAWWGILRFESAIGSLRFKTFRRGKKNPGRDSRYLVELLWLDDAIALLEKHKAARGVKGKPRRVVWDRVCGNVAVDEIASAVRARLKARAVQPTLSQLS
jgi:hypothetical protein